MAEDEVDALERRRRRLEARIRDVGPAPARSVVERLRRELAELGPAPARSTWTLTRRETRLYAAINLLEIQLRGIRTIEGELRRLTPAELLTLTLIFSVKLELIDYYGPLSASRIAQELGLRPRIIRMALASLEALELISVSRRIDQSIDTILISRELLRVRRPRRSEAR